jgi:hypothetical protein
MRFTAVTLNLLAVLAVTGCLGTRGTTVRSIAVATGAQGPLTFEAELKGPTADSSSRAPSGRITLTFRDDDHFEYDMVVRDAGDDTYVAAWVVPRGQTEPLAVLVTDISMKGEYAQLRGTGVAEAPIAGPSLLERLRIRPGDYEIRVPSMTGNEALAGVLGVR